MKLNQLLLLGALALSLAACGGSSGSGGNTPPPPAGAQPTALTAAGMVTGFGSIYVNGIEFETNSASYDLDDTAGSSDSDLSVGMFVVVQGTVNADGVTGTADSVSYDDEVEGPVEDLMTDAADPTIKTFTVLHTDIVISSSTVFDAEDGSAFGFDTIMNGDNVEVSGEYVGDVLHATYVELQDAGDDEYEAKGTISGFNGADMFTLTLDNGATLNVTLAAGAVIPDVGIMDGQYVEVEGTIPDPVGFPDDFLAMKVELEDDDYFDDEDDEVEIKGPLTHHDDDTWSINGTQIVFSESTEYSPESLADAIADGSAHGLVVEVEGQYVDGALHADEVEDEEDDLEFKAVVDAVNATDAKNGTITLSFGGATGTLDVVVNGATFYMDDDAVTPFDLTTLPVDTVVELHAHHNDAGDIVASTLEIEDSLEIEIGIDATTVFMGAAPMAGDYAEVEDNNADGTADTIEADD
jgi:sulfur carrier protein ThiS